MSTVESVLASAVPVKPPRLPKVAGTAQVAAPPSVADSPASGGFDEASVFSARPASRTGDCDASRPPPPVPASAALPAPGSGVPVLVGSPLQAYPANAMSNDAVTYARTLIVI